MGLLGGGNKQSQSTRVEDISSGANVGGDTTAPVTATSISIGAGNKSPVRDSTFNFTDAGAINRSFEFADTTAEKSFGLAQAALEKVAGGFNDALSSVVSSSDKAVAAVQSANEPKDEKERNDYTILVGALLLTVVAVAYFWSKR